MSPKDRAFRIGQQRDVSIYRLIASGTLEELVYTRQIYKQQQSNLVVSGEEEPRYFEGVQGMKALKGELWGVGNLLKLTSDSLMTRDILTKGQQVSGRKYKIKELKLGDPGCSDKKSELDDGRSWSTDDLWGDGKLEDRGVGYLAQMLMDGVSENLQPGIGAHDNKGEPLSKCAGVVYCHQHDTVFGMRDGDHDRGLECAAPAGKLDNPLTSATTVVHSTHKNIEGQGPEVPLGAVAICHDDNSRLIQHPVHCSSSSGMGILAGKDLSGRKPKMWGGAVFRKTAVNVGVCDPGQISQGQLGRQRCSWQVSGSREMLAVESLAAWCGIDCIEMAKALLQMPKGDRLKLVAQYWQDDANPP